MGRNSRLLCFAAAVDAHSLDLLSHYRRKTISYGPRLCRCSIVRDSSQARFTRSRTKGRFFSQEHFSTLLYLTGRTSGTPMRLPSHRLGQNGDQVMTMKKIVVATALLIGTTSAGLAQSAYTTGTIASDDAAGY